MSAKITLTAELREDVGKGASRRLRRLGNHVPAIIYGAEQDPQNLTLAVNEVTKAMEQEAFYSQIMDVIVEGKPQAAVVRDLQRNPANNTVQHVDFLRISANKVMQSTYRCTLSMKKIVLASRWKAAPLPTTSRKWKSAACLLIYPST